MARAALTEAYATEAAFIRRLDAAGDDASQSPSVRRALDNAIATRDDVLARLEEWSV